MNEQVVQPREVADLLRRYAELQHDVAVVRRRLEALPNDPVALLAGIALVGVEDPLAASMERLRDAAELITTPLAA